MAYWDIGLNHIVDVDGQLLAIDADVIDTCALLSRAGLTADRQLWLMRAGERFAVKSRQLLRLSRDEVLYFETSHFVDPAVQLLAA